MQLLVSFFTSIYEYMQIVSFRNYSVAPERLS